MFTSRCRIPSKTTLLLAAAFLCFPGTSFGQVLSDDFDDDGIDPTLWISTATGSGPAASEVNQRLEIAHPASSAEDPGSGAFGAGYQSVCQLRGDYDIQVDYSLLTWPFANGVRVGLNTSASATERVSLGTSDFSGQPRESYVTDHGDGIFNFISTADLTGTLRQVRTGSTITGYYFSGGSWVPIRSAPSTTADVAFALQSWSHDRVFTDQAVGLAFDNFVVNSGELVGDPGTCGDDDGDGFRAPDDCDEGNASVNPDAVELPGNFVDENCDGNLGDCSPCNAWRNHGEYIRCTSQAVDLLVSGGTLTEEEGDALVSSAARSDVGKQGFVPAECQP